MASIPKPTASDIEYLNTMGSFELDEYVKSLKTLEGQGDLSEWYELVARRRESLVKEIEQEEKDRKETIEKAIPMYEKIKPFFATPRTITKEYEHLLDSAGSLSSIFLVVKLIAILGLIVLPILMYLAIISWNYLLLGSPIVVWLLAHILGKLYNKSTESSSREKSYQKLSNQPLTYVALVQYNEEYYDEPYYSLSVLVYAKDPVAAEDALLLRRVADHLREIRDLDLDEIPQELHRLANDMNNAHSNFDVQVPTTITDGKEVFCKVHMFPSKDNFPSSFSPLDNSFPAFVDKSNISVLPKEFWS